MRGTPESRLAVDAATPFGNHQCAWITSGFHADVCDRIAVVSDTMNDASAIFAVTELATSSAMVPRYASVSRERGA